jgi:isopentenyl-diphosphate delta-isomerase
MSGEEKTYKKIIIVDEYDNIIGHVDRMTKEGENSIKRASRVFVFDEEGRILIQRRSANVLKPMLLDQSAAGHVDEGESYRDAAERELKEELGLDNEIEEIIVSYRTPDYFNGVYRLIIPHDTQINFDQSEVSEVLWLDITELEAMIKEDPEQFTYSFLELWVELRDRIIP